MLVCMCYLTSCRVLVILTDTHFTAQNTLLVVVQSLHASGDKHSTYTRGVQTSVLVTIRFQFGQLFCAESREESGGQN